MTLMTSSPQHSRQSEAQPSFATPRRADRPTWGPRIAKVAELLGTPLMPWQRYVADVAGEYDQATGVPFYREVVVTVMRQQGKTALEQAVATDRSVSWANRQRSAYSAQDGRSAWKKIRDDFLPTWRQSPLAPMIANVRRQSGDEAIEWVTGSVLEPMSSAESAGHGLILDLGMIDEAFKDQDDRREQAMIPAMSTRKDAQLWVVSTAGTSKSPYLRRKVENGRHQAGADAGHGVAYFEWSIPDDADVDDPEVWWRHMPALGRTVTPQVVAHARQSMSDAEFRRAFGNQWTEAEHDQVIPEVLWRSVCGPVQPSGTIFLGTDVAPDRMSAAIASAGGGVGELVEHRPGVGWLLDRLVEVSNRSGAPVAVDMGGPAAYLAADLEARGIRTIKIGAGETAQACARLYDWIADGQIAIRSSRALDDAVRGLAKREYGDRFVWSRQSSTTDIVPFMAVTLAVHAHRDTNYDVMNSVF